MKGAFGGLGQIYRKYFGRSFFRKIFLVYMGITAGTGLIMFIAINQNLVSIKYDQALVMSDQIITTVDSYLKNKFAESVSIHQRLYREKESWELIYGELEAPGSSQLYAWQQQEIRQAVINTIYGIDNEFNGLFIGSYADGNVYQYGSGDTSAEKGAFAQLLEKGRQGEMLPRLASARNETSPGNAFSLFLLTPVKSSDFSVDLGCMSLYFSAMNFRKCYQEYEKYLKGNLYIFDGEGALLFDSQARYELPDSFSEEILLTQRSGQTVSYKWIYNILYDKEYGYYVVNAYPASLVREDVRLPRRTMLFVLAAALLVAVVLHLISTHFFARRLEPITKTIEQVKGGNLTSFPIQKKYDDELGYIYTELLQMCASLDDHIQKEYVYSLRQKEMELYTLQAQIDPHFLYNTLEAIRMKLYVKGETEASKMIWMLSDLFRNMMKKDAVVTNREELNYLHSYLELFAFRLGDRMRFCFVVEDEVYRYATIKHILQPIVENALVHGISDTGSREHPCTIRIEGRMEAEDVLFTVADDGCGISEQALVQIREKLGRNELFQNSIGIYNVNSRLRIVYGRSYGLGIDSEEGKGTRVSLRIKAMKKKELEAYVQTVDRG